MEEQAPPAGRVFEATLFLACASVSAFFGEQAYEAVANGVPEAGVAAAGLGTVSVAFAGLAVHEWRVFRGYVQHQDD